MNSIEDNLDKMSLYIDKIEYDKIQCDNYGWWCCR